MELAATIVLPVFALIAVGNLIARTPLMDDEGVRGIGAFVYYIAIPCLMFRALTGDVDLAAVDWKIPLAYYLATYVSALLAMAVKRICFGGGGDALAIFGMGITFPNILILGLPLAHAAYGELGLLICLLLTTTDSILSIGLATIQIELTRGTGRGGLWAGLRVTGRSLSRNPVVLAALFSLAWSQSGLGVPETLARLVDLTAQAALPAALFSLGASLAGTKVAGDLREALTWVGLKLLLHPAAILATGLLFDLPEGGLAVLLMVGVLPIGVNVFILAQHYDIIMRRTASAVVISTALAVFSTAAVIAVMTDRLN